MPWVGVACASASGTHALKRYDAFVIAPKPAAQFTSIGSASAPPASGDAVAGSPLEDAVGTRRGGVSCGRAPAFMRYQANAPPPPTAAMTRSHPSVEDEDGDDADEDEDEGEDDERRGGASWSAARVRGAIPPSPPAPP